MCLPTSEAQDRVIEPTVHTKAVRMMMTPEPFLSAEIAYRQQRVAQQYETSGRRRHWVPRRPTLKLPHIHRPLQIAE